MGYSFRSGHKIRVSSVTIFSHSKLTVMDLLLWIFEIFSEVDHSILFSIIGEDIEGM